MKRCVNRAFITVTVMVMNAEDGIVQKRFRFFHHFKFFCIFELEMMYLLVIAFQQLFVLGYQERNPLTSFCLGLHNSSEELLIKLRTFVLVMFLVFLFFNISSIPSFLGTKKGSGEYLVTATVCLGYSIK